MATWNVDNLLENWPQFLLIIDEYDPDIFLIQESRLYESQILDLGHRCEGYTFKTLLPENLVNTLDEKLEITKRRAQYGLVVATKINDTTTVKYHAKEDNSYFSFTRDGIYFSNIYMPQVGRGDKEFSFALDKLTNNISQNRGTSDLFLMGDWNLSEKHTIKRQEILHKKTRDWNTVITKPKEFTNLNLSQSLA